MEKGKDFRDGRRQGEERGLYSRRAGVKGNGSARNVRSGQYTGSGEENARLTGEKKDRKGKKNDRDRKREDRESRGYVANLLAAAAVPIVLAFVIMWDGPHTPKEDGAAESVTAELAAEDAREERSAPEDAQAEEAPKAKERSKGKPSENKPSEKESAKSAEAEGAQAEGSVSEGIPAEKESGSDAAAHAGEEAAGLGEAASEPVPDSGERENVKIRSGILEFLQTLLLDPSWGEPPQGEQGEESGAAEEALSDPLPEEDPEKDLSGDDPAAESMAEKESTQKEAPLEKAGWRGFFRLFSSKPLWENSTGRAAEGFGEGMRLLYPGAVVKAVSRAASDARAAAADPPEEIPIDFKELQKSSPDVYAWIRIEGTGIDYPVCQLAEGDQSFYLNHSPDGAPAYEGSIYSENYNSREFTDPVTVLYGHDMADGSMFQNLHLYEDMTFFENHRELTVYLPDRVLHYRIFAAYNTDDGHILINHDFFEDAAVLVRFQRDILAQNYISGMVDISTELDADSRILTLSTCNAYQNQRFLVQCLLENPSVLPEVRREENSSSDSGQAQLMEESGLDLLIEEPGSGENTYSR